MTHNWEEKAKALEFESEKEMFQTLYETMSLLELSKALGISQHTCRKKLVENGVSIKSRGGPNGQKCVMNEAVIEEMRVKGAAAVALSQGISKYTLFKQKAKWIAENGTPTSPESPEIAPAPADPASSDSTES